MLMPYLRQGPVFLPSGINSYFQPTANCSMWNSTLQSWHCTVYQADFHFYSYLVSLAGCLNFQNIRVFSVLQPSVSVSVIHSLWSLSLEDPQTLPMWALHTVQSTAFLTIASSFLSCYLNFPSFLPFHECVFQFQCKVRPNQQAFVFSYIRCAVLPSCHPSSASDLKTLKLFLSCFSNSPPFSTCTLYNLPSDYPDSWNISHSPVVCK